MKERKLSQAEYEARSDALMKTLTPMLLAEPKEVIEAVIGRVMVGWLMAWEPNDGGDPTALRQKIFAAWCHKLFQVMDQAEKTDRWTRAADPHWS